MSKRKSDFDRENLKSRQVAKAVEEGSVQKRRINNDEPLRFPKNNETGFITNHELATDINTVMENIFQDYYGSVVSIIPMQTGPAVRVELYFRPTNSETEGFVKAFRSLQLENPQATSLIDRVRIANRVASYDHHFELTQEAAEYLYDFLPDDAQRKVNWADPASFMCAVTETVERPYQGSKDIIYCSMTVDVFKILAFVYGKKEGNQKHGSKLTYEIVPVRPAPNTGDPTAIGANWLLSLSVMSYDAYQEVMNKLGINFNQGRTPIVVSRKNCS